MTAPKTFATHDGRERPHTRHFRACAAIPKFEYLKIYLNNRLIFTWQTHFGPHTVHTET